MNTNPMTYRPFCNGTESMSWREGNCDRCWKSRYLAKNGKSRCAIETALSWAVVSDGTLLGDGRLTEAQAERLAKRLGWSGEWPMPTDCPEREEKRPKYAKRPKPQSNEPLPLFT